MEMSQPLGFLIDLWFLSPLRGILRRILQLKIGLAPGLTLFCKDARTGLPSILWKITEIKKKKKNKPERAVSQRIAPNLRPRGRNDKR